MQKNKDVGMLEAKVWIHATYERMVKVLLQISRTDLAEKMQRSYISNRSATTTRLLTDS